MSTTGAAEICVPRWRRRNSNRFPSTRILSPGGISSARRPSSSSSNPVASCTTTTPRSGLLEAQTTTSSWILRHSRSAELRARHNCARLVMEVPSLAGEGNAPEVCAPLSSGTPAASSRPKVSAPANPILFNAPGIARQFNYLELAEQPLTRSFVCVTVFRRNSATLIALDMPAGKYDVRRMVLERAVG